MTYATPYLLSLGLSKSKLSLVWVAGPLSGLVMQPIVGMIADKSTSKYGRRRPFMIAGTVAVFFCYVLLGWTQEVVAWFVSDKELVWYWRAWLDEQNAGSPFTAEEGAVDRGGSG
jgi:solute carrier family 45, member 1/2/4